MAGPIRPITTAIRPVAAAKLGAQQPASPRVPLPSLNEALAILAGGLLETSASSEQIAFLEKEIAAQNKTISRVQETLVEENGGEAGKEPQHLVDARTLSATELRERYATTYSSWTNMKSRAKLKGVPVDPAFGRFMDFLTEVGPRPTVEHTLDRIDPANPKYGPGLVRWLDKEGQANNRELTLYLTVGGETKPLSVWARETNQKPDTLRRRHREGWSHEEIIHGQRAKLSFGPNPWNYRPWSGGDRERDAEAYYQQNGRSREHAIVFAIRVFETALHPWTDFVAENYHEGVDQETERECLEASQSLSRFNPVLAELRRRKAALWPLLNSKNMPANWSGPLRFRDKDARFESGSGPL